MEERKTIDELIALYSFEDTVKDIYVEGERDKNFFSWLIDAGRLKSTGVYSISDIDVSNVILDKHGLPHGSNRSRLIAAAMELSEGLPGCNNVIFVADRDYEDYLPRTIETDLLEFTDYNSIESYILNEEAIRKVISIVYGCYSERTPNYYFEMKSILREIFSIRLANESLGWFMEWLDFKKYIKITPKLVFDNERFVEAYLRKNTKWSKRDEFYTHLEACRRDLQDDCRLSIRGHDFTTLLHHYMNKKFQRKKIDKIAPFEGFMLSSLDRDYLLREGLLKKIHEFSIG